MSFVGVSLFLASTTAALPYSPRAEERVELALRALPAEYRDGATVLAYGAKAEPEVLLRGTNGWTCVADDPEPGIYVSCYYRTWEALWLRFNGLVGQGSSFRDAWDVCEADVRSGKLPAPTPVVGFELVGVGAMSAQPFVLFYVPYATAESLGLSTEPDNQRPWLMQAGRINAHVMAH